MHPVIAGHWARGITAAPQDVDAVKEHDVLALRNAHVLDAFIVFRESDHFYGIGLDGKWVTTFLTSATKVLEPFAKPFYGTSIARNIGKSQKKKREAFFAELAEPQPMFDGFMLVHSAEAHEEARVAGSYAAVGRRAFAALPEAQRHAIMDAHFGEYLGCEDENAVQAMWRASAAFGTRFHAQIERFFNDQPVEVECQKTWAQFLSYRALYRNDEPYRTEWRIHDRRRLITGTIDAAFVAERDAAGRVTKVKLVDWKTCKDIHKTYGKPPKYKAPLAHMNDDKKTGYAMQLNVYREIIETYYGLEVTEMAIVVFHRNYDDFQYIAVPRLERETRALFDAHEARLVEKLMGHV